MAENIFTQRKAALDAAPPVTVDEPPMLGSDSENVFAKRRAAMNPTENLGSAPANERAGDSWLDRTGDRIWDTGKSVIDELVGGTYAEPVGELTSDYLGDPLSKSPMDRAQTAASTVVKAAAETIFDTGLSFARALLPDDWEEAMIDTASTTWKSIASNPTARKGIEAAKEGVEAWNEWSKEHPDLSRRLSEVIDIGTLGRAKTAVVSPGKKGTLQVDSLTIDKGPTGSTGTNVGERVQKQARVGLRNNRRAQVKELMDPPNMKGDGTFKINKDGVKEYVPSQWEEAVNDEVVKVAGVNPKKPITDNMNAVRARSKQYHDELDSFILARGNPPVDMKAIQVGLANKLNALMKEPAMVGTTSESAYKVFELAKDIMDKAEPTATGLMKARRELDKALLKSSPNLFDASVENGIMRATRVIRSELNDQVGKATKSTKVKTLLEKQHKLLTAGDMLEVKALKEADTRLGRMIQKIEAKTGMKLPTTPVAQYAVGATAAAGATALGGPPALAALGGLFAIYKGGRWLRSPAGRNWAGKVISTIEGDPLLRETLATDRAALIELMNSGEDVEDY